jgi:hypothetical protein
MQKIEMEGSNVNRYNIYIPVWSHYLQDEQDLLDFRRI